MSTPEDYAKGNPFAVKPGIQEDYAKGNPFTKRPYGDVMPFESASKGFIEGVPLGLSKLVSGTLDFLGKGGSVDPEAKNSLLVGKDGALDPTQITGVQRALQAAANPFHRLESAIEGSIAPDNTAAKYGRIGGEIASGFLIPGGGAKKAVDLAEEFPTLVHTIEEGPRLLGAGAARVEPKLLGPGPKPLPHFMPPVPEPIVADAASMGPRVMQTTGVGAPGPVARGSLVGTGGLESGGKVITQSGKTGTLHSLLAGDKASVALDGGPKVVLHRAELEALAPTELVEGSPVIIETETGPVRGRMKSFLFGNKASVELGNGVRVTVDRANVRTPGMYQARVDAALAAEPVSAPIPEVPKIDPEVVKAANESFTQEVSRITASDLSDASKKAALKAAQKSHEKALSALMPEVPMTETAAVPGPTEGVATGAPPSSVQAKYTAPAAAGESPLQRVLPSVSEAPPSASAPLPETPEVAAVPRAVRAPEAIPEARIAPESEPVPSATTKPKEFLNYAKFGLDQTGEARVRAAVERLRTTGEADKGYQSFIEQGGKASDFAKQLLDNPLEASEGKLKNLSGAQIVGMHEVVGENTRLLEQASKALSEGRLSPEDATAMNEVVDRVTAQNNEILSSIVREKAQTARDLGFFRQVAKQTMDPEVWLVQAKKMLGDRHMSDSLMLEIRALANEARAACGA